LTHDLLAAGRRHLAAQHEWLEWCKHEQERLEEDMRAAIAKYDDQA
jgi:hypothetical protein